MTFSIDDYNIPTPPPRHQAKVVKDESLKDDTLYEVQFFDYVNKIWSFFGRFDSEKSAKNNLESFKLMDNIDGVVYQYRIVKLTIKKEVVVK